MADGGWHAGEGVKANRSAPRVEQIGFRLLVSVVWLAVVVWMLVVLAFAG